MIGLLGAALGAIGFLGNVVLIVVIYIVLLRGIDNIIFKRFQSLFKLYRGIRDYYYKIRCTNDPENEMLQDKYRRSRMHIDILALQSYILLLNEQHGGFRICPKCNFPYKPDIFFCPNCNNPINESYAEAVKFIQGA